MPRFRSLAPATALRGLVLFFILSASGPSASAQEQTSGDSQIPLVYKVENTGAKYPQPAFASFDKLPIIRPLPDPFVMADGKRVTSFAKWELRRNQIKAAIEKYEIGPKPDCSDCTVTANYVPPQEGSAKGTLTVVVTRKGKSLTLTDGVYLPKNAGNGPFPAIISMTLAVRNKDGGNFGALPAALFADLPIATVDFLHNQVAAYGVRSGVHTADPFYQLYPELCAGTCDGTSNSGEYAAWSWGVSRLIDGMEIATHQAVNPLPIDMEHLAVTGCSYAGKMALFAGAFDERIALTISQENGGGGAPSWRVSHEIEAEGSVEKIDTTSKEWFAGQMWQFAGNNVYKLPEDHDELMDMVAPRALLETGNTDYYWLTNRANYISARATQQVYNTLGIGDRFGFFIDGKHPHCQTLPKEAPAITAFVDKFLLSKKSEPSDVEVNPFPTLDYKRWTAWWGTRPHGEPQFPNPWIASGTFVLPLNTAHLNVQAGQTVQAAYQLMIPGSHPDASASLVDGQVQADIRCGDGSSYTLAIPLPANQSYSIPANSNKWISNPGGPQGSIPAAVCGTAPGRGLIQEAYFSSLGVAPARAKQGGAGITTSDAADALEIEFSCSANGVSTASSAPVNVNPARDSQ